jgi:hypothetical protein
MCFPKNAPLWVPATVARTMVPFGAISVPSNVLSIAIASLPKTTTKNGSSGKFVGEKSSVLV